MTLEEILRDIPEGTKINTLTNDDYKQLCVKEGDPEIKQILKDYAEALREASNYYVRA
jgi:hypothetical protein